MSCSQILQKYDLDAAEAEHVEMKAALWGVDLKKSAQEKPPNGRPTKQTMTAQDIMRKYG